MLEKIGDSIWVKTVPHTVFGIQFGCRMTVIQLDNEELLLHSPVPYSKKLAAEVAELGVVKHVIAPNQNHHLYVKEWMDKNPQAQLHGPRTLHKKRPDLKFASILQDIPHEVWQKELDQVLFQGNPFVEEVDFFHRKSKTLILTDLCLNLGRDRPAVTRLTSKLFGVLDNLSMPRTMRFLTRDRDAARDCVERMLEWDFEQILLAHGDLVLVNGKERFVRAFDWLLDEETVA